MLCLKFETNPGWIKFVLDNLNSVPVDQTHCERKEVKQHPDELTELEKRIVVSQLITQQFMVK